MTRVAIYARMSTDKQSADSPEDQIPVRGLFPSRRSCLTEIALSDVAKERS